MATTISSTTTSGDSQIEIEMEMATVTSDTTTPVDSETEIQTSRANTARSRQPDLDLLQDTEEARKTYMRLCVPLHKLALKGNWKDASPLFEESPSLRRTAITKERATALHVAAGANRLHFVEELVKLMDRDELKLQDEDDNTALFLAAAAGNPEIAQIMINNNDSLPIIRGKDGLTPLHFAVIHGNSEMAKYLYPLTTENGFENDDWVLLFLTCVNAEIFDLAKQMLEQNRWLAFERDRFKNTGLHLLARKRLTNSCVKQTQALQLVNRLWTIILSSTHPESYIKQFIRNPSPFMFDAATVGNFEFLAEIISSYPILIGEKDYKNRSIIHVAVLNRHAKIFNLVNEIGSIKDFIVTSVDDDRNTLLHMAAKLAPPDQLNIVSGAAFQLMLELVWFEEVKKIMPPLYREVRNSDNKTPRELFTEQHEKLVQKAEDWMKQTAGSCMIVSTVFATGLLTAAFSLPGGNNDNEKAPSYLRTSAFLIFTISNAVALISSSTSTLAFLSILISRYAEYDFYWSLPLKLSFGLVALFISITSMMAAFSSSLFITYYHGVKWVPGLVSILAFLMIPSFGFLQFPLWFDIIYSTYYCRSLFRPKKSDALLKYKDPKAEESKRQSIDPSY